VEGTIVRIAPLVDQLARFCRGHQAGDRVEAAEGMLWCLRALWPEIPARAVPPAPEDDRDVEGLALTIIVDVGEIAQILITSEDPREQLAWARANLTLDVERYAKLVADQA
jgi:hypothetical protein